MLPKKMSNATTGALVTLEAPAGSDAKDSRNGLWFQFEFELSVSGEPSPMEASLFPLGRHR
jgi:hypothetical protein